MKADLHIHSLISDGDSTISEIIDIAYKKKLDVIAITDHDTTTHIKQLPANPKIKIIAGIEISAIDNQTGIRADILGYGIKDLDLIEKAVSRPGYIDVSDAVNVIQKSGGAAVLAHSGRQKNFYLAAQLPFDGIEYNHPSNSDIDKKIIRNYASRYGLFLTGGSDFHGKNDTEPVEIGDYLSPQSINRIFSFLLAS